MSHDDLLPVFDLDLVFVTGKGGVGKSLVSAAIASEAARVGLRPLLVQLGSRTSMEAIFGTRLAAQPTFVGSGVTALSLDPNTALVEYLEAHLPAPRLARLLARSAGLRWLFRAAPGVPELVSLDRLARFLDEREPGRARWRPIIVDLDASGHARMFFDLPRVLGRFAAGGPLEPVVGRVRAMLEAPGTGVCLVGLGTPLAGRETQELYRVLVDQYEMLVAGLVINDLIQPPLPGIVDRDLDQLDQWAASTGAREVELDVDYGRRVRRRYEASRRAVAELRAAVAAPCVEFPRLEHPTGAAALRRLAPLLTGGAR